LPRARGAAAVAHPVPSPLPEPDAAARAHSVRVAAAVATAIERAGGFLPLARYLDLVLHAPGLGYYAAGAQRFGPEGDFVTAPELTGLFGAALATQVAAILSASPGREIVEPGAGTGALAVQLLRRLQSLDALPQRDRILEPSPALQALQRERIGAALPHLAKRVEWLAALPDDIDGAVVMNEVLDAIAPHVVVRRGGAWHERGVVLAAAGPRAGAHAGGAFGLAERPLADARLVATAQERFPAQIDYASEVNPAAEALVEALGRRLRHGALLIIDYGFPRAEYYHPQRHEGTLVGHYRHRVHADPLLWPGLSDLTAHVDFTAIAEAGERAGLHVAGYTSQAAFLLACGLLDRLAEAGEPRSRAYLREAGAVQKLMSPAEMGELFKVLALARDGAIAWPGFALDDRSRRL
jgi:SAM-dependent MidA family methyltransferase